MTATLVDPPATSPDRTGVRAVLDADAVRSVYQPIVDLSDGRVVGFEALARGPVGPWEAPATLFTAARESGCLDELDAACRRAAFRGARDLGLTGPFTLFVNVEPEVLDTASLADLTAIGHSAPGGLRVVLEITERALAARPSELLQTVQQVRALGWGVALDDLGADSTSLAFMALVQPDVVKLDLGLIQGRASRKIAELAHAVNAYAERTGAVVLAEGIEDETHLARALAMGATVGQGWYFGRPTATPVAPAPSRPLPLSTPATALTAATTSSPFDALPAGTQLRRAPKRLLVELSKHLERDALQIGASCVVAATFQEAVHFTPSTRRRYRELVDRTGFVCALGEGLPVEPLPGLRGAALDPGDPVRGEWDIVVLGPHFSAALLARDLGCDGPDSERLFEYAVTYERGTVVAAATSLLSRVTPRPPSH